MMIFADTVVMLRNQLLGFSVLSYHLWDDDMIYIKQFQQIHISVSCFQSIASQNYWTTTFNIFSQSKQVIFYLLRYLHSCLLLNMKKMTWNESPLSHNKQIYLSYRWMHECLFSVVFISYHKRTRIVIWMITQYEGW